MNAHLEPDDHRRWEKCVPKMTWSYWLTLDKARQKYQEKPAFTNDQSRVRESK